MKTSNRDQNGPTSAKILIPIGNQVNKELITQALHVFSIFKNPLIVLLTVIEVPSRTATLETEAYRVQITDAERRLNELAKWLTDQDLNVRVKVAVARNVVEGIIDETESDGYLVVFMMKRKAKQGWRRLFTRSVSQQVVRGVNCFVMTAPLE